MFLQRQPEILIQSALDNFRVTVTEQIEMIESKPRSAPVVKRLKAIHVSVENYVVSVQNKKPQEATDLARTAVQTDLSRAEVLSNVLPPFRK